MLHTAFDEYSKFHLFRERKQYKFLPSAFKIARETTDIKVKHFKALKILGQVSVGFFWKAELFRSC